MVSTNPISDDSKLAVTLGTHGDHDHRCLLVSHGKMKSAVTIAFQRTLRVPDNKETNNLPPSLGEFPLFNVADYKDTMSEDMVKKGGIFFPVFQKEAMWINFSSKEPFAIKIYVGGVNAISGVPINESPDAALKRLKLSEQVKQDYIVLPEQPWLDGIASEDGKIRQFVAMPKGSGYSVEAQVTGEEKIGGIQFEITPVKRVCPQSVTIVSKNHSFSIPTKQVILKLEAKIFGNENTIGDLKKLIREEFDITMQHQSLLLWRSGSMGHGSSVPLNDESVTFSEIWVPDGSTIEVHNASSSQPDSPWHQSCQALSLGSPTPTASSFSAAPSSPAASSGFPLFGSGQVAAAAYAEFMSKSEEKGCKDGGGGIDFALFNDAPLHNVHPIPMSHAAPTARSRFPGAHRANGAQESQYIAESPTALRRKSEVTSMSLAPGGLIKQSINADTYPVSIWDLASSILFNVQLLNSQSFFAVTGNYPPTSPINAATYKTYGYPFYDIWNEEVNDIKGNFGGIKSVATIDEENSMIDSAGQGQKLAFWSQVKGDSEESKDTKGKTSFQGDEKIEFPIVMLDMNAKKTFKPLAILKKEADRS